MNINPKLVMLICFGLDDLLTQMHFKNICFYRINNFIRVKSEEKILFNIDLRNKKLHHNINNLVIKNESNIITIYNTTHINELLKLKINCSKNIDENVKVYTEFSGNCFLINNTIIVNRTVTNVLTLFTGSQYQFAVD